MKKINILQLSLLVMVSFFFAACGEDQNTESQTVEKTTTISPKKEIEKKARNPNSIAEFYDHANAGDSLRLVESNEKGTKRRQVTLLANVGSYLKIMAGEGKDKVEIQHVPKKKDGIYIGGNFCNGCPARQIDRINLGDDQFFAVKSGNTYYWLERYQVHPLSPQGLERAIAAERYVLFTWMGKGYKVFRFQSSIMLKSMEPYYMFYAEEAGGGTLSASITGSGEFIVEKTESSYDENLKVRSFPITDARPATAKIGDYPLVIEGKSFGLGIFYLGKKGKK